MKCAKESAGKRSGTSGTQIGNAQLTWAFSEAAVFCLRDNPAGQQWLARLAKKPSKGKALTILAHTLARAISSMRKRQTACDLETCLHAEGRGGGARTVSLDSHGMHLLRNARHGVKHCVLERP